MTDNKPVGTFRCYSDAEMRPDRLKLVMRASAIVEEYERAGMCLTVRQLYYQHVARGLIPNEGTEYDRLQALVNAGRMAGLISWTGIEDRGRNLMGHQYHSSPGQLVRAAASGYRMNKWRLQRFRPEVWVEKQALEGVVETICSHLEVDFYSCRGYNSQSEQWRAGRRFARYVGAGQTPIVFHLGDHDPSGIDMTRDNRDRLSLFAGVPVQVVRLALNMPQIEQYQPPPNPAKLSDSRSADYVSRYGSHSWELDALEPKVLRDLVSDAVLRVRDEALWSEALAREADDRRVLLDIADEFGPAEGGEEE